MEQTMNEWPAELLAIFEDPLLAEVKPKPEAVTADDRVQRKIDDLRAWMERNGREPLMNGPISEKLMAISLQTLKEMGLWI